MFSARKGFLVLVATVLLLSGFSSSFGAVTGKIQGHVVDARTGEGLPSAAVQIVGTTQGDLTTPDGSYLILNVSPGTYSIRVRLVGYKTTQVDEIRVTSGRSTEINVELESTSLETDIVQRVTAERDIMEMKNPGTSTVLNAEQMEAMPVQNVEDIISATMGVVKRYGELHIRGGRSGEVSYVVDGVETKDPLGGLGAVEAGMNLSSNSIEEVQIIKGGFDPEYGRAMSGIVTVNTKTGSQTTEGYMEFFSDDLGAQNLNTYSRNFDRLYFSLSGPEPFIGGRLLPALGVDYFKDKLFYFVALEGYKSGTPYNYNELANPGIGRDYRTHDVLGLFTIKDRQQNHFSLTAKMTYKITNNLKTVFNYQGIWDDNTIFNWYHRDTPSTAQIYNRLTERFSVSMTHQLNKSTFYEVVVSRVNNDYIQKPDDPNNPGAGLNPNEFSFESEWESFDDMNGNGTYDRPEPFVNVYADTSYKYGGRMYNFGDVFIPDSLGGNVTYGWDNTQPYPLYDPWDQDSIKYPGPNFIMLFPENFVENTVETILWDWNGDGLVSFEESEPFVDLNNNGRWDRGDRVRNDQNGNGRYDEEFASIAGFDRAEPYIDGDINLGEPFFDYNNNGVYEEGIDRFVRAVSPADNQDLNRNSAYDGPDGQWTPGIPFKDLNGNGVYDSPNNRYDLGEPFTDVNNNGKWDGADGFLDRGYSATTALGEGTYYHQRSAETWTADFKITKQIVREHELKTGLQLRIHDLDYAQLKNPWILNTTPDQGPFPDRGIERDFYEHEPVEGALFIQDIIEYGSLVARVGFRYDFFFQSDGVDTLVASYQAEGRDVIDSRSKLSPRMGISYPITEKAKIYFNYGHFYQLPSFSTLYARLGFDNGVIGNPNLDYEKTVSYEFGVRYNLSGDYVLDIAGFYKDIFGIINTQKVRFGQELYQYDNTDYGRARGFEIQLEKKYGNYVSGYVNYTYAFAYGKASSESENYEALVENREIPIQEFPLDWDVRHRITLNFDLRITKSDHPKLFGYTIPNDWGMNVLWSWNTGYPFTPAQGYPGLRLQSGERVLNNSLRYPSFSQVDVRFNKNFSVGNIDYSFEVWVENIFDIENTETVYSATGRPDTGNNVGGYVRGDTDFRADPEHLSPGRNVRLGITVKF